MKVLGFVFELSQSKFDMFWVEWNNIDFFLNKVHYEFMS